MKFDEIVKALRLCGETTECISERIGCPYCENTDDCKRELLFDAADIIEAQQQEIDRLEYTLKKARDLLENANSNGILEHVARNCMFIKEIDDLLGGKEDGE